MHGNSYTAAYEYRSYKNKSIIFSPNVTVINGKSPLELRHGNRQKSMKPTYRVAQKSKPPSRIIIKSY